MATKKEINSTENETFDISQFFTREAENNGVWYTPELNNCEFEFLLCGLNSDTASVADDEWRKEVSEISESLSEKEKSKKADEAFARRIGKYVLDIRGKNGKTLTMNGKKVTKEDAYTIFYNSPLLLVKVSKFVSKAENFLGKGKND